MQSAKLLRNAPINGVSQMVTRSFASQSLFQTIIRKINKVYHGSETPYVKKDEVLEMVIKAEKWNMPRGFAKINFLRDRARAKYVKHNVTIRKLEDKVTGGAVGIQSFQNKF